MSEKDPRGHLLRVQGQTSCCCFGLWSRLGSKHRFLKKLALCLQCFLGISTRNLTNQIWGVPGCSKFPPNFHSFGEFLRLQVRPYVHKILVVIEPLLIDEDYFARVEGPLGDFFARRVVFFSGDFYCGIHPIETTTMTGINIPQKKWWWLGDGLCLGLPH